MTVSGYGQDDSYGLDYRKTDSQMGDADVLNSKRKMQRDYEQRHGCTEVSMKFPEAFTVNFR
jgi:hypothetical protein